MSIEVTVWAWEQNLQPLLKLVLLAVADGGDPGGEGPPPSIAVTPERLAERCSTDVGHIIEAVRTLISMGLVTIDVEDNVWPELVLR